MAAEAGGHGRIGEVDRKHLDIGETEHQRDDARKGRARCVGLSRGNAVVVQKRSSLSRRWSDVVALAIYDEVIRRLYF